MLRTLLIALWTLFPFTLRWSNKYSLHNKSKKLRKPSKNTKIVKDLRVYPYPCCTPAVPVPVSQGYVPLTGTGPSTAQMDQGYTLDQPYLPAFVSCCSSSFTRLFPLNTFWLWLRDFKRNSASISSTCHRHITRDSTIFSWGGPYIQFMRAQRES
jgi:hypothetical protein